jgi:hypothetical protein
VRVILDKYIPKNEEDVIRRRGYTFFESELWPIKKEEYYTSTTFAFVGSGSPGDMKEVMTRDKGISPSIYLGPSPRFLIGDTLSRPLYVLFETFILIALC